MKPKVFFTKKITPEKVTELYDALGIQLPGKVAVKVHSGEQGNQNFLRPDFWAPMVEKVNGTVVECNTAYGDAFDGVRDHTDSHLKLLKLHGWADAFDVDLMDAEGPDLIVPVPGGKVLKTNALGKNIRNYDSMLVLAHFKGHPMGGFGGALKQLSIGCASSRGKALIHSGGVTDSNIDTWQKHAAQDAFCEAMADAASTVVKLFEGRIAFINVMKNLSVDCDCCSVAEDPCMRDIGILASLDPVAIDQACLDLVYAAKDDPGQRHFLDRVESRHGVRTVEAAALAGVDSVEHGAYLDTDALQTMAQMGTVWVPTLSTVANLRGKGRFCEEAVVRIWESAAENVSRFAAMGGLLGCGSDAGAWAVPHGCGTEEMLFQEILGQHSEEILEKGFQKIREKF